MINSILILLLLHTVIYLFLKKKSTVLSCGLFGYIGQKDNHTFNWDKFNYLGRDNDIRGGDSVGRMIGDVIEKHVNAKKHKTTYEDYVINFRNVEASHMALGHTRKASVGGVSESKAQPIELEIPTGEGMFVMVHNGTIYNWEALAKKYNVSTKDKTDSMVLAEIIMENGYDVLKEYVGAAAIIIRDDRKPDTFFVFKGSSIAWQTVTEERPLYCYRESENSMYISSREEGLFFIGGDVDTIEDFDTNTLYEIHEGNIISETIYDRSKMRQSKTYTNRTYTTRNNSSGYHHDDFDYGGYANAGMNAQSSFYNKTKIFKEPLYKSPVVNSVIFSKFRYWKFQKNTWKKLNGIAHISERGILFDRPVYNQTVKTKVYYFIKGVMLADKVTYDMMLKKLPANDYAFETSQHTTALAAVAMHPVCTLATNQTVQDTRWYCGKTQHTGYYTGKFKPFFCNRIYKMSTGDLDEIETTTEINKPDHTKKVDLPIQDTLDTDNKEDENPDVIKEIDNCISALLLAIDSSKNDINIMDVSSPSVKNTMYNLDALEELLINDESFKSGKVSISYDKPF